ncbi:MAG: CHAT domain-containing protein [Tolypothrix brevis GSE-NOS-MK-07-07A]|jgi:hypothetical protein|nr:CHAT domain-containing protein [Tolypothrix brevis GSE-NOS-MK-07-07A]
MKKILILSANPKNTDKLRLDEEVREIKAALKRAKSRDEFELFTEWAVRVDDLRRALLDYQPTIVHFSGHGEGSHGLALENNSGQMQLVSTESLGGLFELFKTKIECVFLNACYSETQAEAIYQHINYVVGMNQAIGDRAAINFAKGFYDALGAGKSYGEAYKLGCNAIALDGIPEHLTPVIKVNPFQAFSLPVETQAKEEKNSQPKTFGGISQSVSGGQVFGGMQAAQGDYNQQTMQTKVVASDEKQLTQEEVIQMLAQVEQLLQATEELPQGMKEKSLRYLETVKEEVQTTQPDKQFAAGNLKRMAETLKNAGDTVTSTKSIWENVKPILMQLSSWLGVAKSFFGF